MLVNIRLSSLAGDLEDCAFSRHVTVDNMLILVWKIMDRNYSIILCYNFLTKKSN